MPSPKILILGATGYIGGTYLHDLLKTFQASDITTLVRDEAMKEKIASLGVTVTIGTLDDLPLLTRLVTEHDVVVNFAVPFGGGDHSIQAIVDALEQRAQTSEIKPVFIHTSGTGGIMYGQGGVSGSHVWKDSDHDRWEELPATAYFQSGNRIVAKAAEKGIISAYIISSPTVYGKGLGQVNLLSLQIPAYVRYAKRTGQAAYIGQGDNIWGNVHVEDLSALYNIVLRHSLEHPQETEAQPGSHGWSNLIYAGVGQHTWKPVAELLGDLLHARGEIPNKGAISIGEGEGDMYMFGGNSWMEVSEKAKALGWKPTQPDLMTAIRMALPPKA